MNKSIVLYPRGFLGFDIGLASNDPSSNLDQVVQAIKFNKPVPKKDIVVSNHDIDALWKEYNTGTQYVTQFGFREKILIAALRAFGTLNFKEWCELQEKSPYFTDLHRRFMNDTFAFILTGNRSLNVQSWSSLIDISESNHKDREVNVDVDSLFTSDNDSSSQEYCTLALDITSMYAKPTKDLTNIIHFWVARHNGFEDMIASLQIFFGSNSK